MVAALGVALCATPAAAELSPRFTDPEAGFSIQPPKGWRVLRKPVERVPVAFVGPSEGDFAATLNVVVVNEPIQVNAGMLAATVRRLQDANRAATDSAIGPGRVRMGNYRVTKARVVKLFGKDAAFIEALYDDLAGGSPIPTRNFQVIIPGRGRHFVLTYSARESQYARLLPLVQESVNTFTDASGGPAGGKESAVDRGAVLAALAGVGLSIALLAVLRRRRRREAPPS